MIIHVFMDISLQTSMLLWISLDFYGYPCIELLLVLDPGIRKRSLLSYQLRIFIRMWGYTHGISVGFRDRHTQICRVIEVHFEPDHFIRYWLKTRQEGVVPIRYPRLKQTSHSTGIENKIFYLNTCFSKSISSLISLLLFSPYSREKIEIINKFCYDFGSEDESMRSKS